MSHTVKMVDSALGLIDKDFRVSFAEFLGRQVVCFFSRVLQRDKCRSKLD